MIVFKLSESSGTLENQYLADKAMVHDMLDVMQLGHYKDSIVKATRLGRPETNSVNRPLRVEFTSYLDREAVVRNGYHLAGSEEFGDVGVSRDLIKEDRIISRNNYLMKKQQKQQNEASTGTSDAATPNAVEETPEEASNETVPATQGNTDRAATGGGDQASPRLVGETSEP